MSFKCMAWAAEQKTGKSTRKFILLMLADRANDEGLCWPSLKRVASDCETTKNTVITHIKALEELGLLTVIHRSKDGVNLPNHYQLPVGGVKKEGIVQKSHQGSVEIALGGSVEIAPKPIRSFNQSSNLSKKNTKKVKHKYGSYGNVLLTDEDYSKLTEEFPHDYSNRIENLSGYVASHGKAYKDHLATIRNWARNETKPKNSYGGLDMSNSPTFGGGQ